MFLLILESNEMIRSDKMLSSISPIFRFRDQIPPRLTCFFILPASIKYKAIKDWDRCNRLTSHPNLLALRKTLEHMLESDDLVESLAQRTKFLALFIPDLHIPGSNPTEVIFAFVPLEIDRIKYQFGKGVDTRDEDELLQP